MEKKMAAKKPAKKAVKKVAKKTTTAAKKKTTAAKKKKQYFSLRFFKILLRRPVASNDVTGRCFMGRSWRDARSTRDVLAYYIGFAHIRASALTQARPIKSL